MITQQELKEIINYNPETGEFIKLIKGKQISNTPSNGGYLRVAINKKRYQIHKLAFMYMNGIIPETIDHIDGDKLNNKWSNLRVVSQTENNRNASRRNDNTTGTTGVYPTKNGKFTASIGSGKSRINLGTYLTIQEATQIRKEAEIAYGYHTNHGRI